MTREIVAEYLAEDRTLKLQEPLEGVADHCKVRVTIQTAENDRPWLDLRGSLPDEAVAEWKRALEHD